MSGRPVGGVQSGPPPSARSAVRSPALGEDRVRRGVAGSRAVAAHRLDAGGDEHVTLARLDGVGSHADRLQARRAVAVDGHAGHVVEAAEHGDDAGDVEARLPRRLAAPHDEVLDLVARQLRHLIEQRADDLRRQVIGADRHQRALPGTPDRAPGGSDDDGFGHGFPSGSGRPTGAPRRAYRRRSELRRPARRRGSGAGTAARSARRRRTGAASSGRGCHRRPRSRPRRSPRR